MNHYFASDCLGAPRLAGTCCLEGLHVLLVDDAQDRRGTRRRCLERQGFEVRVAAAAARAIEALRHAWVADVVIVDLREGDMAAATLVDLLRVVRPWLPAVIVGRSDTESHPALRDASVTTRWVEGPAFALQLVAAVISVACPARERRHCPFHHLLGTLSDTLAAPDRDVRRSAPGP